MIYNKLNFLQFISNNIIEIKKNREIKRRFLTKNKTEESYNIFNIIKIKDKNTILEEKPIEVENKSYKKEIQLLPKEEKDAEEEKNEEIHSEKKAKRYEKKEVKRKN